MNYKKTSNKSTGSFKENSGAMRCVGFLVGIVFIFAMFTGIAFAESKYDWQTGNFYNWRSDSIGNTNLRGFNTRTGSSWNTNIKPDGSMSGWDSNMNYWIYNNRSKTYLNFGTGKMRYRGN